MNYEGIWAAALMWEFTCLNLQSYPGPYILVSISPTVCCVPGQAEHEAGVRWQQLRDHGTGDTLIVFLLTPGNSPLLSMLSVVLYYQKLT